MFGQGLARQVSARHEPLTTVMYDAALARSMDDLHRAGKKLKDLISEGGEGVAGGVGVVRGLRRDRLLLTAV